MFDATGSSHPGWDGASKELLPGITLLHCAGHFAGAQVLHWADGAGGKGALLSGDIVTVNFDRKVSFMRSYPDLIPLDRSTVGQIAAMLQPWPFEPIYGAWWDRFVPTDGKAVVAYSVRRYLDAISGPPRD